MLEGVSIWLDKEKKNIKRKQRNALGMDKGNNLPYLHNADEVLE